MSDQDQGNNAAATPKECTSESDDELEPMLSLEQVLKIVPVSRTTLWRMEREGKFPQSRQLTGKSRAWLKADVRAWQKALPVNRRVRKLRKVSG